MSVWKIGAYYLGSMLGPLVFGNSHVGLSIASSLENTVHEKHKAKVEERSKDQNINGFQHP